MLFGTFGADGCCVEEAAGALELGAELSRTSVWTLPDMLFGTSYGVKGT